MDNSMKYIVIGAIAIIGIGVVFYLMKNQQASNSNINYDSHNVTKATSLDMFNGNSVNVGR